MKLTTKISCLLISIALLCYTVMRAFNLSFTHDESFTYLYSSHNSFMEIISNRTTLISANNHILNTLFMKLFDNTIGSSEIALRLQSILAHIVYLVFTFLLLKNFKSQLLIVMGFILLNTNPYLLEFFALARGYALAISFMFISIYFFLLYSRDEKNKQLIYCMVSAALAVLSNFALLNYFAAIILIHQVVIYFKYKDLKVSFSKSKIVLITIVALGLICYEPLRKLIRFSTIDFGGNTGIWEDTVASQVSTFLYDQPYAHSVFQIIDGFIFISVLACSIIFLIKLIRGTRSEEDKNGLIIFSVLLFILFFNALQHYLLGSPYIVERFALFISPLYILSLIYLLNVFSESGRALKICGNFLVTGLTAGILFHFSRCANISYATNWRYDASTKEMIADLIKEKESSGKQKVKLGITWLFEPGINFYRETKKLDWLEKVNRKGVSGEFDYYYITPSDRNSISGSKKIIKEYPETKNRLLE